MDRIFLTFIVPTFNSERTIGKCLSSIFVSDEIEVIVVDNLSSDSTVSICSDYNVKVYRVNSTIGAARNYAAKRSSGDYVIRLDGDEAASKSLCEELIRELKKYKPDVVRAYREELGYWRQVIEARDSARHYHFYDGRPKKILWAIAYRKDFYLRFQADPKLCWGEDSEQMERMRPHIKTSINLKSPKLHLPLTLRSFVQKTLQWHKHPPYRRYKPRRSPQYRTQPLATILKVYLYVLRHHPPNFFGAVLLGFISSFIRQLPRRVLSKSHPHVQG